MAIGHIAIRPHSRSAGHTAAAALAYRFGLAITCTRTGDQHDYTRRSQRGDIGATGLTPGPFSTPAHLAAAIETAERRVNSRILRDVQIAIPSELSPDAQTTVTERFATALATRYHTMTAWAVHPPDRRGDDRNHHGHIVLPTRAIENGQFGKKLRDLDGHATGPVEIEAIRELWEEVANEAMVEAGLEARVHTGRTSCPAPTLGASHTGIERRAWTDRHTKDRDNKVEPAGLSVEDLVADGCATGRGQRLARHVERHADAPRSVPVPGHDVQVPLPLLAPDPAPQAQPARIVVPTGRGVRLGALPAAAPDPAPQAQPARIVVPTGRGVRLAALLTADPAPQAKPGPVIVPTARGVRLGALPAAAPDPAPQAQPARIVVPTGRGVRLAALLTADPAPQAKPGPVIVPTARGVRLGALAAAVPDPAPQAQPARIVVPTGRGVRLGALPAAAPDPAPQAQPARIVVPTGRGVRLAALLTADPAPQAKPGPVIVPTARGVRLGALAAAVPDPAPQAQPARIVVPTGRGVRLAALLAADPAPQAKPGP